MLIINSVDNSFLYHNLISNTVMTFSGYKHLILTLIFLFSNSISLSRSILNDIISMLYTRLRERWKFILLIGGLWLLFLFPIPFLPFLGYRLDINSLTALYIVTAIVSIPFTLLGIFMNHKK